LIAGPLIALIAQVILESILKSETILGIVNILVTIYIFLCIFSMFSFTGVSKIAIPIKISFWVLPLIAILPLIIIGLFYVLPIGNMAHLGGYIAGAAYGLYLRFKYKKKTQLISEHFSN
jgi:membrane associated rhomboid family serine protease